jgi:hypothetical protein
MYRPYTRGAVQVQLIMKYRKKIIKLLGATKVPITQQYMFDCLWLYTKTGVNMYGMRWDGKG